jgi:predicted small lipoprotein YifL
MTGCIDRTPSPLRGEDCGKGIGRRAILAIAAALVLLPLAACGKKGPLEPPPGATNVYPRVYPSGATPSVVPLSPSSGLPASPNGINQ